MGIKTKEEGKRRASSPLHVQLRMRNIRPFAHKWETNYWYDSAERSSETSEESPLFLRDSEDPKKGNSNVMKIDSFD